MGWVEDDEVSDASVELRQDGVGVRGSGAMVVTLCTLYFMA